MTLWFRNLKVSTPGTMRSLLIIALAGYALVTAVGATSAAKQVTITNRSDRARTITRVRTTSGFGESNNCGVLNPSRSCKVEVTFSPTVTGERIGALIVRLADRDDDSGPFVLPAGMGTKASGSATLSGVAMQGGATSGATVSLYAVSTSDGSNSGAALATATSDSSGNFTLKLASIPSGPVRLTAAGGSFASEMNGATISPSGSISVLLSGVTANQSGSRLTRSPNS